MVAPHHQMVVRTMEFCVQQFRGLLCAAWSLMPGNSVRCTGCAACAKSLSP